MNNSNWQKFKIMERKRNRKDLILAYKQTINNFEIELGHLKWYQFKKSKNIRNLIAEFESKIVELYETIDTFQYLTYLIHFSS